jgi:hypothetical protein
MDGANQSPLLYFSVLAVNKKSAGLEGELCFVLIFHFHKVVDRFSILCEKTSFQSDALILSRLNFFFSFFQLVAPTQPLFLAGPGLKSLLTR